MQYFLTLGMVALSCTAAAQGLRGVATTGPDTLGRSQTELHLSGTNQIYRSRSGPRLTYSGALVQAAHIRHPWQLFNPFAPESYGTGLANTDMDFTTGRAGGVKLFSVSF